MNLISKTALLWCVILIAFAPGNAQDKKGTPPEAIALVQKAVDYIKSNGAEKAFAEFRKRSGKFTFGDLYISVYDMKGFCVAHPDPKKDSKDLSMETDPTGKLVLKERIAIAKQYGKGWANYKGKSLVSDDLVDKSVYLEKYEDYIVCCAVYGFTK